MKEITEIWELREGSDGPEKKATYSLSPKKAMVCYIKQFLEHDLATWNYPDIVPGMRQSQTVKDHWYFDEFQSKHGVNAVIAAYPA